jgi:hypothetical protein
VPAIDVADTRFGGDDDDDRAPWVTVYWANGYEEAHIVRGALEAEGIPAMLRAESAVYGSTALGGVKVQVPRALEDRARQVLTETPAQPPAPMPEDPTEP